jgi:4-hydroxy 2-oxovalerate aldolase
MTVTLLDCTLRDGGYYNDWDYTPELIRRYVSAMHEARVPVVELGFRTAEGGRYLGPTGYTTDRYLATLDLPSGPLYGVMMNAKEMVATGRSDEVVDHLFGPASESVVGLARIASNFSEVPALRPGIERLHELGYRVGLNLMQIASRTEDEVRSFAKMAREWGVEIAYFADSFGGMTPPDIARVVRILVDEFAGPVGCHTHDNMSLAFANTISAIEAGATWVDATVLGMGRGPGNARTEYVAYELARRGLADVDGGELLPLVTGDFAELQRQFGWGSNIYYFLSAAKGIHPTYIQEMTKDGRYSVDEIVGALDQLGHEGGGSFSHERMEEAAGDIGLETGDGTFDVTGWCNGRQVLIVGPGPAGVERRRDVEAFIRAQQPLVLALNPVPPVDPALVDAYALCHPVRAMIDADQIAKLERPVFMPQSLADRLAPVPSGDQVRDYGLTVDAGVLSGTALGCTLPKIANLPYALAIAAAGGASEVLLSGFDGFDKGDPRQAEMEHMLVLFASSPTSPPVVAVTKTTYPVRQSSIYAF